MNFRFSKYALASKEPSPINKMTESFSYDFRSGVDINLGVGYVNDDTIPQSKLYDSFAGVLRNLEKYKSPINYGAAKGSQNLIQSIKNYYKQNSIGGLSEEQIQQKEIIIGANGATSILDAIADVLEPGIVVTADPMYYIYTETLLRKGFTLLTIPEDEDGMQIDILREKLLDIDISKISFFYIVTINNPSTVILSNNRRKELVELVAELSEKTKNAIPLIFDKAYEDIIYGDVEKPVSGLIYDKIGNVLEIGTLSKIIAPALRIGYAIGENTDFLKILMQKISDVGFSSSLIMQEISSYFLDNYVQQHKIDVNQGYKKKAKYMLELIDSNLSKHIENVSGGEAGFYFYITFKNVETHTQSNFYKFLSRTTGDKLIDGDSEMKPRLIYVPGEFCVNQEGFMANKSKRQLRLSFGFADEQELRNAVFLIKEAVEYSIEEKVLNTLEDI